MRIDPLQSVDPKALHLVITRNTSVCAQRTQVVPRTGSGGVRRAPVERLRGRPSRLQLAGVGRVRPASGGVGRPRSASAARPSSAALLRRPEPRPLPARSAARPPQGKGERSRRRVIVPASPVPRRPVPFRPVPSSLTLSQVHGRLLGGVAWRPGCFYAQGTPSNSPNCIILPAFLFVNGTVTLTSASKRG